MSSSKVFSATMMFFEIGISSGFVCLMLCKKLLVIHHDGEANQKKQARSAPDVARLLFFQQAKKKNRPKKNWVACVL